MSVLNAFYLYIDLYPYISILIHVFLYLSVSSIYVSYFNYVSIPEKTKALGLILAKDKG